MRPALARADGLHFHPRIGTGARAVPRAEASARVSPQGSPSRLGPDTISVLREKPRRPGMFLGQETHALLEIALGGFRERSRSSKCGGVSRRCVHMRNLITTLEVLDAAPLQHMCARILRQTCNAFGS